MFSFSLPTNFFFLKNFLQSCWVLLLPDGCSRKNNAQKLSREWVTIFHCSGTEKELTVTGFICCFEIWITSDDLLQTKQEKKHLFPCLFDSLWLFEFRKKKKESKIDRNFQTFVQCCFIQSFPNFVLFSVKSNVKKKLCGLTTFFF